MAEGDVPVSNLFSKILAGGLSAGVFLLWWPHHVHGDGVEHLVLRGALWALAAELLLLAFAPLENAAARHVRVRLARRRDRLSAKVASAPPAARAGGAVALACLGVAAPALLMLDAGVPASSEPPPRPKVVERVIVKRPVVRERIIVQRVAVPVAAPTPVVAPERTTPLPARTASRSAPTSEPKTASRPAPTPKEVPAAQAPPQTEPTTAIPAAETTPAGETPEP